MAHPACCCCSLLDTVVPPCLYPHDIMQCSRQMFVVPMCDACAEAVQTLQLLHPAYRPQRKGLGRPLASPGRSLAGRWERPGGQRQGRQLALLRPGAWLEQVGLQGHCRRHHQAWDTCTLATGFPAHPLCGPEQRTFSLESTIRSSLKRSTALSLRDSEAVTCAVQAAHKV